MAIIENFSITTPVTSSLLSKEDRSLVETYTLNSAFNTVEDRAEAHIYTTRGDLLLSDYDYRLYKVAPNRYTEDSKVDTIEVDPLEDARYYGYSSGDIEIRYVFLKRIGTEEVKEPTLYIESISPDRTELVINSTTLEESQLDELFENLKSLVNNTPLLGQTVLNFKTNKLAIVVNVGKVTNKIAIKLYEPLPTGIEVKSTFTLNDIVNDVISYQIFREFTEVVDKPPSLKGPNFSISLENEISNPTEYLNTLELLENINSSVYEPYSNTYKLGIDISIDYTDPSSFVHFSSYQERVKNFKYKLDILAGYEVSRSLAENIIPSFEATASVSRYGSLIEGIINNFDHYDRHLYFESGSTSWPKSTTTKPYSNLASSHPSASLFYNNLLATASLYDERNEHRLINSIPSFLKEDLDNAPYNLFIDMIGQHFDNLWIYAKATGDRYDADNRVNKGISKDLVGEALRSFGTKLYSNNSSFDNLFSMFVGEFYQTGSEVINTFVTASNVPVGKSDYQKEIYKRLYHNTPLLLKSKGTERGIKALFSTFGVPSTLLKIQYAGGVRNDSTLYYGPDKLYSSSLDRIRVDNTGSLLSGNSLSYDTSIIKPDSKYTQDLHTVQIGFSPSDFINEYVISSSLLPTNFNIDNYIGDPGTAYSGSYDLMNKVVRENLEGNLTKYDLKDLVRLVKFYDNSLFKMVKDQLPARTNAVTGIIVKPTVFNRSKVKQVKPTATQVDYSGSTTTATITGDHGRSFKNYNTAFAYQVRLPSGSYSLKNSLNEARFTGELTGSQIIVANGELNSNNIFKKPATDSFTFRIRPLSGSAIADSIFSLTLSVTDYPT